MKFTTPLFLLASVYGTAITAQDLEPRGIVYTTLVCAVDCPDVNPTVTVYGGAAGAAGTAGAAGAAGAGAAATVTVATTLYVTPTTISTYVPTNGVITIGGDTTNNYNINNNVININNAPTTIITTVMATSTVVTTVTTTTTPSNTASSVTTLPTAFLLQTTGNVARRDLKVRDASVGGYASGSSTAANCQQGDSFILTDGILYSSAAVIGTSAGVDYQPFITFGGSITSGFSVSSTSGVISWANSAFPDAVATFCLRSSTGELDVIFNTAGAPTDCITVGLQVIPASTCASNSTTSTPTTSPSGAPYPADNGTSTTGTGSVTASAGLRRRFGAYY